MTTLLSILASLLLLSVLVAIHEFGHYASGRLLGFSIVEYAIGMGPVLFQRVKNGIQYSLRALPIGGMCRFYGEDEGVSDEKCFNAQVWWKRLIVILSGPLMNFVFAVVVSVVILIAYGDYVPSIVEIGDATTPAYVGGLQVGDVITSVDGKKISYYSETVPLILAAEGGAVDITVERSGQNVSCHLTDIYNAEAGKNLIGITIQPERMQFGLFRSVTRSFRYTWSMVTETFAFFGRLFQGNVQSTDVAGPVGIVAYISEAVRYDFETVLRFAVMISMSLGIMNLLPLPALDGGRAVFMIVEGVRGKPVSPEKEGMVHFVGLILLFGLVIFLTFNDISNIIGG